MIDGFGEEALRFHWLPRRILRGDFHGEGGD